MMKFLITSIILTWVWIWSFRKIVVEENRPHRVAREYATAPISPENFFMFQRSRPSYNINHNPLVMMWFGLFTYLMATIWFVWIHYIFGLDPDDEDQIEENDMRANDSDDD